jgi:hypothetical protein
VARDHPGQGLLCCSSPAQLAGLYIIYTADKRVHIPLTSCWQAQQQSHTAHLHCVHWDTVYSRRFVLSSLRYAGFITLSWALFTLTPRAISAFEMGVSSCATKAEHMPHQHWCPPGLGDPIILHTDRSKKCSRLVPPAAADARERALCVAWLEARPWFELHPHREHWVSHLW